MIPCPTCHAILVRVNSGYVCQAGHGKVLSVAFVRAQYKAMPKPPKPRPSDGLPCASRLCVDAVIPGNRARYTVDGLPGIWQRDWIFHDNTTAVNAGGRTLYMSRDDTLENELRLLLEVCLKEVTP